MATRAPYKKGEDALKVQILESAESGDYRDCLDVAQNLLGMNYRGVIPSDNVPATRPATTLRNIGTFRRPWTALLTRAYAPGCYVFIGRIPNEPSVSPLPDASRDLPAAAWKCTTKQDRTLPGFTKRIAVSVYPLEAGGEPYAMRATVLFRDQSTALACWNEGKSLVQVIFVQPTASRYLKSQAELEPAEPVQMDSGLKKKLAAWKIKYSWMISDEATGAMKCSACIADGGVKGNAAKTWCEQGCCRWTEQSLSNHEGSRAHADVLERAAAAAEGDDS